MPAARRVEVLVAGAWQTAREPEFMAMLEVTLARRSDAELRGETDFAFSRMERLLGRCPGASGKATTSVPILR